MLTRHAHNRRNRNRLLRGRAPRRGGQLTLRQQIGAVLGVEPQVFADARDLDLDDTDPVSTFGDWTMQGGAFGPATYDADGWGGSLPLVNLSDDRGTAADFANYAHGTPAVWTFSGVLVGTGTSVLLLHLAGPNATYRRFYFNANQTRFQHQIRNDAGTVETEFGQSFSLGPVHAGIAFTGTSVSMCILNADGAAVHLDNAPVDATGPSTYNVLNLGAPGSTTFNVGITSLTRCSAGAATVANLQAILAAHNNHYPVA